MPELLKAIMHEININPWVIKECRSQKMHTKGFVDRPALIFWINKTFGNCYETFICQALRAIKPTWDIDRIEEEAHKLWAEANSETRDAIKDFYFWLSLNKKHR